MRLGYVLKRYPRYSETFIVAELLAHQAAGLEVEIFALRSPNETVRQPDVDLVRYPVRYLALGPEKAHHRDAAAQLAAWVEERDIDLLHAHFATSATSVAAEASALVGVPFTFTAHAKDIYHAQVDTNALGQLIRKAARVVTVSEFNRAFLTDLAGTSLDHVVRIYNGIDIERFPIGIAPRNGRILGVGRMVAKKGFGDLVAACGLLRDRGVAIGCDLVGSGPLEPALRAQVEHHGLIDQIQFHGVLPRDQVARLMAHSSVFVAPCVIAEDGDRDGLPTVLLEAMALGVPSIATDVTGIPEMMSHGTSGQIVGQHRPDQIADGIVRVLTDPAAAASWAANARGRVCRDFDLHRNAADLRAVFRGAIASSPIGAQ